MKHTIDGEEYFPLGDLKRRYEDYQKRYDKITQEKLDELVKQGHVKRRTITAHGFNFLVNNDYEVKN